MSVVAETPESISNSLKEISLRDIYYIVFRNKWKMMLIFLAVASSAIIFILQQPDVYRSQAKLMVQLGRENVTLDPTATTGQLVNVNKSLQHEIQSELEILNSRDLAENVVDTLGADVILQKIDQEMESDESLAREIAILAVVDSLSFEALDESTIIEVSYDTTDPELSKRVLSTFLDLFLEKHIAVHQVTGSYQFFSGQTAYLRENLKGIEDKIQLLGGKTGISSPEEYRNMHLQRFVAIEREIESTEADIAFSTSRVETLQRMLEKLPEQSVQQQTTGYQNSVADKLKERLYDLQLEERELATKFDEGNRTVRFIRQQISEVKELLDKEESNHSLTTYGPNTAHQNLQLELLKEIANSSALHERATVLKNKLESMQAFLETLTADELEIRRLLRELNINEESYRKYSGNLEQVRIDHALKNEKISNISVVQPATLPMFPLNGHKPIVATLGVVLGLSAAFVLALFSTYANHSIITPEQVREKLGLPTITSIPHATANIVSRTKRRESKGGNAEEATPLRSPQWSIPNAMQEEYALICQRVRNGLVNTLNRPQVVAVASCSRREGVSTVAANLATVLAQQNEGKTLLIDTNVEHPIAHSIFDIYRAPGLNDVRLQDKLRRNSIQASPVANLSVLTAGMPDVSLDKSFNLDQFRNLLGIIRERYEFVVLDVPALEEVKSAISLCGLCDGTLLVVETERLRWEAIKSHKEQLDDSGANVLGVVLNKRRYPIPDCVYRTL